MSVFKIKDARDERNAVWVVQVYRIAASENPAL
jgi:hypothetical protein